MKPTATWVAVLSVLVGWAAWVAGGAAGANAAVAEKQIRDGQGLGD